MGAPMRLTNNQGISLSLAVWLADDEYDYVDIPGYISATTLIKSPRQIILGMRAEADRKRVASNEVVFDIKDMMANRFGSAVHGSIEGTWINRYKDSLRKLGYPEAVISKIRINPSLAEAATGNIIPVYLEQRTHRTVGNYTIGGKFDFIGDGVLDDFKTTGVFSYMSGSNDWKYRLQGSLYRWLNPEIITADHMNIQFIFTDWSKAESMRKAAKGYPATKMLTHKVMLMSLPETELWVQRRISLLDQLKDVPEANLPLCEAQDLWQDSPTFKYYKNPNKLNRSTKNFDTRAEANIRLIEDGSVGCIIEVPGEAKACKYCDSFQYCTQKDALIEAGTLKF